MSYRTKNSYGKIRESRNWYSGETELFIKRLRIDNYQHPDTGEPINAKERAEFQAYYRTLIDE